MQRHGAGRLPCDPSEFCPANYTQHGDSQIVGSRSDFRVGKPLFQWLALRSNRSFRGIYVCTDIQGLVLLSVSVDQEEAPRVRSLTGRRNPEIQA